MFEIKQTGFSAGLYTDTEYIYDVQTDLNWMRTEEKVKEWLRENKLPTMNRGEWMAAQKSDPSVACLGYYTLNERKMGGWNLRIVLPNMD